MRMVYSVLFAVMVAIISNSFANAAESDQAGIGTYSEGWRIGQITKLSFKGWIWKSGEGEMLVGNESTMLQVTERCGDSRCTRVINPWAFSTSSTYATFIEGYIGEYIVLRYRQARIKSIKRDTEYEIMDAMAPLDAEALAIDSCVAPDYGKGGKSAGTRVGRLVKLSSKGTLTKTHEITMQFCNTVNKFHYMSIPDGDDKSEFVSCLLQLLMSGAKVKVKYSESFIHNPLASDTGYDIISVKRASTGLGN